MATQSEKTILGRSKDLLMDQCGLLAKSKLTVKFVSTLAQSLQPLALIGPTKITSKSRPGLTLSQRNLRLTEFSQTTSSLTSMTELLTQSSATLDLAPKCLCSIRTKTWPTSSLESIQRKWWSQSPTSQLSPPSTSSSCF